MDWVDDYDDDVWDDLDDDDETLVNMHDSSSNISGFANSYSEIHGRGRFADFGDKVRDVRNSSKLDIDKYFDEDDINEAFDALEQ